MYTYNKKISRLKRFISWNFAKEIFVISSLVLYSFSYSKTQSFFCPSNKFSFSDFGRPYADLIVSFNTHTHTHTAAISKRKKGMKAEKHSPQNDLFFAFLICKILWNSHFAYHPNSLPYMKKKQILINMKSKQKESSSLSAFTDKTFCGIFFCGTHQKIYTRAGRSLKQTLRIWIRYMKIVRRQSIWKWR